ncbi:UDP-GalNAc:beta-1,3-N-acetylgalactosaminyltransferase 1-like isoform X2 [Phymastichus coffea]|uniref:UDP-GalNAc:beta-1, 3-N-acetylgalactosaminyltransferase 1-like isoform X2 n=1 Tax=Phymastichus coffea TaxID=108790 RepID=UPI00273BC6A2|nr:UDP-GalNAc:beta-1,3-N-acetylgalactosaminyltransferase 1-like isoform X2 [Phymastichus coffea]
MRVRLYGGFTILRISICALVMLGIFLVKWISDSYNLIGYPVASYYSLSENYTIPFSYVNRSTKLDKSTLINLQNFKFIINHDRCQSITPIILILIHSAPQNFAKRNFIRTTWGGKLRYTSTFFLVGFSKKYNYLINQENLYYKDLIQGNFIDSYRNMTYKHAMAFKWVIYHCPGVKYVLKLDDDAYVNMNALLKYAKYDIPPFTPTNFIFCDVIKGTKVGLLYIQQI